MNLEDVIDPEYGLQQDDWSLSKPRFGKESQLEVVVWSGLDNGPFGVCMRLPCICLIRSLR